MTPEEDAEIAAAMERVAYVCGGASITETYVGLTAADNTRDFVTDVAACMAAMRDEIIRLHIEMTHMANLATPGVEVAGHHRTYMHADLVREFRLEKEGA